MNKESIIKQTEEYVRKELEGEATGHDWWHVYRVWQNAINIGKNEGVDLFVVQLAALLHDIADWKFTNDVETGPKAAGEWLEKLNVDEDVISHVCEIIRDVSFKGAGVESKMKTKEGMVVQDADRLDALGAVGVARCFATGAKLGNEIHDPRVRSTFHKTFEEYKKLRSTSINHFYEKLLFLKNRMNTETAKKIAEERHKFMEQFLERFYKEWEGLE